MRTGVNTRNYTNYQLKYDARQLRDSFSFCKKNVMFINAVFLYIYVTSATDLVENRPSVGRDSSGGTVTRYGLDGPGIESRWRRDFPHPFQTDPGPRPASFTKGTGFFPGVKRPGRWVDHPPHLPRRLKKE
jgi:hypothetical protein